jgi:hypothetical protein
MGLRFSYLKTMTALPSAQSVSILEDANIMSAAQVYLNHLRNGCCSDPVRAQNFILAALRRSMFKTDNLKLALCDAEKDIDAMLELAPHVQLYQCSNYKVDCDCCPSPEMISKWAEENNIIFRRLKRDGHSIYVFLNTDDSLLFMLRWT